MIASSGFSHKLVRNQSKIEAVFVLDSTGSMSGLLQTAKDKIWAISNTMARSQPTPIIRIGLVTYRDRGDQYVTKRTPLSKDLDSVYSNLMSYRAGGGGDSPESVNQALNEAVHNFDWSNDSNTYRVIFLVGDAPPHMDYEQDVKYYLSCSEAIKRKININTIQCGQMGGTEKYWREIAKLGNGEYFRVEQSGGAVVAKTPYDQDIARLSHQLDQNRTYWGSRRELKRLNRKKMKQDEMSRSASSSSMAQRAEFNLSKAGRYNREDRQDISMLSEKELDQVKNEELPVSMQKMSKDERKEYVKKLKDKRTQIEKELKELTEKRKAHLSEKAKKVGKSKKSNFENSVFKSIRNQAREIAGISIEETPSL